MPFKSEKQRKYMYANHPEIAKRWSKESKSKRKHEVDAMGRLLKKMDGKRDRVR